MQTPIDIVLVDDHRLFRKGLASILAAYPGIRIAGEAGDGNELFTLLETMAVKPQVILLDLNMPGLNGIETTRKLKALYPEIRILVLTVHDEDRFVAHLIKGGVNGYLFKNAEPEDVYKAITGIMQDGIHFSPAVLRSLQTETKTPHDSSVAGGNFSGFTRREEEILLLICQELSTEEIADKLCLSLRTVNGHKQNLLDKTGARNTSGLILYAIRNQLFLPG